MALQHTKANFELVIRSQHPLPPEYVTRDLRVTYAIGDAGSHLDLFRDVDAVIHPRRYGGLNMVANEALISGLPVVMTNTSPNDAVLRQSGWSTATPRGAS
jgi:glycosyltransferase involved in cell wall biosynthesis